MENDVEELPEDWKEQSSKSESKEEFEIGAASPLNPSSWLSSFVFVAGLL